MPACEHRDGGGQQLGAAFARKRSHVTTIEQDSAAIARMLVALMRTVSAVYYPGMQLIDGIELVFVGIHVFLGYVERRPMTVSRLSRALGMSRATVVRRLETLIEVGYVKRQENFYCPEEGVVNTPYLRDVLARASKIVITTAKELSKMDTEA
jgi:predicted transcriptional regulator